MGSTASLSLVIDYHQSQAKDRTILELQSIQKLSDPAFLARRQSGGSGSCDCLSGGAIAGIVIGCIVGTLLLVWIFSTMGRDNSSSWNDDRPRHRRHSNAHSHYASSTSSRRGRTPRYEREYS
ncbi:hypothetical protein DH86_00001189, partial [Scytalidium sp. 3C]